MVFSERKSISLGLYLALLVFACIIYVTPIPGAPNIRIDAIALLILYVNFYRPVAWPLSLGFCTGLLQDLVAFAPLGQHALGLVFICFMAPWFRDSLRMLPPLKQLPLIIFMLLFLKFLSGWVTALNLGILPNINAIWAVLLTSIFWPMLIGLFESSPKIRRVAS